MNNIKMVDLKSQHEKIKTEIQEAINEVLDNTSFINGPAVKKFQSELESYLKVKHVIPCANGTDALQIALMSLGLEPNDEIITVSFTFVATVEVIALLGLTPVYIDVNEEDFNIDVQKIEDAIGPKTKAIIPVHLFGQSANMEKIMELANKYNLYVIEDTAQALGADYIYKNGISQKVGTIGNIGATSFFPSKNLGCYGDGGALFTNDDLLAEKMREIANHGMKVRYYHSSIGVNSRLDSIQAAILSVKLKYLDKYNESRHSSAMLYNKYFSNSDKIITPKINSNTTHIFHQYTLKIKDLDRNLLQKHLENNNIPAMIYYPVPLHMQEAYNYLGYKYGQLPITEGLSQIVLSLPMHTELSIEQIAYISQTILDFINK